MKIEFPLLKMAQHMDESLLDRDLTKKKEDSIMKRVRDLVPKKLSFLERTKNQRNNTQDNLKSLDKHS